MRRLWSRRRRPDPVARQLQQQDAERLRDELGRQHGITVQVLSDLAGVEPPGLRALATTALTASLAERTFRVVDRLPEWQNAAGEQWRGHLGLVWRLLAGEEQQRDALAAALTAHLAGPLHHTDGQDGPDDADRPQTVAALAAVRCALAAGQEGPGSLDDAVEDAVAALFDAVDLAHDQQTGPERTAQVARLVRDLGDDSRTLRRAVDAAGTLPPQLLAALRRQAAAPVGDP